MGGLARDMNAVRAVRGDVDASVHLVGGGPGQVFLIAWPFVPTSMGAAAPAGGAPSGSSPFSSLGALAYAAVRPLLSRMCCL